MAMHRLEELPQTTAIGAACIDLTDRDENAGALQVIIRRGRYPSIECPCCVRFMARNDGYHYADGGRWECETCAGEGDILLDETLFSATSQE